MDDITTELVLQIQIDDLSSILNDGVGRSLEGTQSYIQDALVVYRQDLRDYQTFLFNRRPGSNINETISDDAETIKTGSDKGQIERDCLHTFSLGDLLRLDLIPAPCLESDQESLTLPSFPGHGNLASDWPITEQIQQ